jgi:hypothetical protein
VGLAEPVEAIRWRTNGDPNHRIAVLERRRQQLVGDPDIGAERYPYPRE